jgi:hypothetical protein
MVDSKPEKDPISVDCQKQAIMSHRDTILIRAKATFTVD